MIDEVFLLHVKYYIILYHLSMHVPSVVLSYRLALQSCMAGNLFLNHDITDTIT